MAATTLSPVSDRISFMEPSNPRRMSNSSNASSNPEDHFEDWTKTTSEKESWAFRERRRSNVFSKVENLPIGVSPTNRDRRRGSVLGMFQYTVDQDGKPILLSDDKHEDFVLPPPSSISIVLPPRDERRLSMSSDNEAKRRGSILSLWKTGKDREGKQMVHSGHEGEDWEVITDGSSLGSGPPSPNLWKEQRGDRRGSVLSIWKHGKDKDGKNVILSGEEHDGILEVPVETAVVTERRGSVMEPVLTPPPQRGDRRGSVLSMWTQGRDKDGKNVILSGEEHDGIPEVPVETVVVTERRGSLMEPVLTPPPGRGERRGSVLSMWSQGTDKNGRPIILSGFEEDSEDD